MSTPEKKEENTKELVQKLTSVVKVSKEQKQKIYKKLFINFLIAIIVFVYFFVLHILFSKLNPSVFERTIHVISCVLVIGLIVLMEIAYRKDNDTLAVFSMESFFIVMLTVFMPYVYLHRGQTFRFLYSVSSIYIAIYYSFKCLIIYLRDMKKYKNELSDVKEIVNDKKKKSYLDERSKRKYGSDPVIEENTDVVTEKDSRIAKLEKMQERIRENQEKRKIARANKKEKKEQEAVKQNVEEKYKPIKEEKEKDPVKEEKIKETVKEKKPRKKEKELEPIKEGETIEEIEKPVKRKRGRPRKVKPEETNKE